MAIVEEVNAAPPDTGAPGVDLDIPARPLVSIRPGGNWAAFGLFELWAYRELLFFLTLRDVQIRYKQTALGVAWAVLQPLCTMILFTLLFGRLAGFPSDGVPYPLFAFAALLPWTFFSNAVTNSGNSLVSSAHLITKVYFPRLIIPGAAVGAALVDLAIGFALLVPLMGWYGVAFKASLLALPVFVALVGLLALGVGLWASALNVKYRDVRHALPFLIQLWMYSSPIIYPLSMVPLRWRWVLVLNPLTGIIVGFRSALFGRPFDWLSIAASTVVTLAVLASALVVFRRMEKTFADIV
jgi:lipopolysaccharide transport system permease protein